MQPNGLRGRHLHQHDGADKLQGLFDDFGYERNVRRMHDDRHVYEGNMQRRLLCERNDVQTVRSRVLLHRRGKKPLPRRRVSGPDGSVDVQAVLGGTLRGERFETARGMHLLRGGDLRGERRGDRLFELSVRDFREQLVQHGLHPLHRPERADVWEKRTVCGGNELFGLQRVHGRMHGRYMSVRHGEGIGTLLRGVRRDVRHVLFLHDVVLHQLPERILSESGRVLLV